MMQIQQRSWELLLCFPCRELRHKAPRDSAWTSNFSKLFVLTIYVLRLLPLLSSTICLGALASACKFLLISHHFLQVLFYSSSCPCLCYFSLFRLSSRLSCLSPIFSFPPLVWFVFLWSTLLFFFFLSNSLFLLMNRIPPANLLLFSLFSKFLFQPNVLPNLINWSICEMTHSN